LGIKRATILTNDLKFWTNITKSKNIISKFYYKDIFSNKPHQYSMLHPIFSDPGLILVSYIYLN
jgi:hypothetical protein